MLPTLTAIAGIGLLVWGANRFVAAAAGLASRHGVSPLTIGMVIVGFGTSMPELTVSAMAVGGGATGVAIGNAYGSNIVNIALILGLTALVHPIAVHSNILRRELPVLVGVSLLAILTAVDGTIGRIDALIHLTVFGAIVAWTLATSRAYPADPVGSDMSRELERRPGNDGSDWLRIVTGLAALLAGSRLVVWSGVEVARALGISDLTIGLTVIAVGTSLPELASSIVAASRGEDDLAIGNVLGSNLFNALAVIGTAAALAPLPVDRVVLTRDLPVMTLLTLSLFLIGYGFRRRGRVNRYEGAFLLLVYAAYTAGVLAGLL